MQRRFRCMNKETANKGSRQSTINIVTSLQVAQPKDLGLTPRNVTNISFVRRMPIEYGTHTAYFKMGAGKKGLGLETAKKRPTAKMKDERYIPQFPLPFVHFTYIVGFYIYLLPIEDVAGVLIPGYFKDINLCHT